MSLEAQLAPAPGEALDPGMNGLPPLDEPQSPEADMPELKVPDNVTEFMKNYEQDVQAEIDREFWDIIGEMNEAEERLDGGQVIGNAEGEITVTQTRENGKVTSTEVEGEVTELDIIDLTPKPVDEEVGDEMDDSSELDDFALWESEIGEPDDLEQGKDRGLEEEPKSDILGAEISEEMWEEIDQLEQEATEGKVEATAKKVVEAEIGKLVVSGELDQEERELAEAMLSTERAKSAIDKVTEDSSETSGAKSEDQKGKTEAAEVKINDEKKLADLEAELKDDFRQHVLELAENIEVREEPTETYLGKLSEASIGAMVYIESAVEAVDNPEDKIDAVLDTTQEAAEALSEYEDEGIKASKQVIAYAADRISSIIAEAEKAMIADAEAQKAASAETARSTANVQFAAVTQ